MKTLPKEMPLPNRLLLVLACMALVILACAEFRGGWDSVPYVGDVPVLEPSATAYEAQKRSALRFPGLELGVTLSNRLRTYDTRVYFLLPLSIDPREVHTQEVVPGKTRVFLRVMAEERGVIFRPREALLSINDQVFRGEAGFEFGRWNEAGERVTTGGRWDHRDVGDEFTTIEAGRAYLLSIDFPVPSPSPESPGIALDLAAALLQPGKPALPLIRFVPVRWKEGYT